MFRMRYIITEIQTGCHSAILPCDCM